MKRECLTVAVILLFIGLALSPGIYADNTPKINDEKYVEFTTEVCGLPGIKPKTVKLTQQQANEVLIYLNETFQSLNDVETRLETVEIINEAITKLDSYGLFGEFSVEQVQHLVIDKFKKINILQSSNIFDKLLFDIFDQYDNAFCMVFGFGWEHFFWPVPTSIIMLGNYLFGYDILSLFRAAAFLLFIPFIAIVDLIPLKLANTIMFTQITSDFVDEEYIYASGSLFTYGIKGKKSWVNQILIGNLTNFQQFLSYRYPGIGGFTGIRVGSSITSFGFYLGSATLVDMRPNL